MAWLNTMVQETYVFDRIELHGGDVNLGNAVYSLHYRILAAPNNIWGLPQGHVGIGSFNGLSQHISQDPLAIDLDGDGIETIGADGTMVFDHDDDGVKTGTGWVKADDAFVVLDRNGNGLIDTGAELFGVDTVKADGSFAVDGFDALSDLDSNGDGVFDAKDSEFANVRLWQDMDQDGVSDEGELTSLTDAGIVSINLEAKSGNVNLGNGNVQTGTAAHLTVDGERAPPAISTWCSIRFTANLPIR